MNPNRKNLATFRDVKDRSFGANGVAEAKSYDVKKKYWSKSR